MQEHSSVALSLNVDIFDPETFNFTIRMVNLVTGIKLTLSHFDNTNLATIPNYFCNSSQKNAHSGTQ